MSSVRENEMSLDLGFGENRALLQIQRGAQNTSSRATIQLFFFAVFVKASIHGKFYLKPWDIGPGNRASG